MAGTLGQVIAWQDTQTSGNLYLDIDTTTTTAAQIYAGSFDGTANITLADGTAAVLTREETGSLTATMALNVSTSNAAESGWNLIAGSTGTIYPGTAYQLSIDDADAFDLEFGTAVSGTGTVFDGDTLFEDDASNTLKFAKISA